MKVVRILSTVWGKCIHIEHFELRNADGAYLGISESCLVLTDYGRGQ